MSTQPINAYPNSYPDARIDQVLNALRTTESPSGLEQRIAARLAQAAEARMLSTTTNPTTSSYITVILNAVKDPCSLLAPAKLYTATALTLLVALTTLPLLHHHTPGTTARTAPILLTPPSSAGFEAPALPSRQNAPTRTAALAAEGISRPRPTPTAVPDPDAIALAETLAPSRPAPPMPRTAQEQLIAAATRPGQPIQLAELDLARAPLLRAAAQARETARIDRYVKTLLAPFAVADALSPTTFSQPPETSTPPPPPNSSSN
jgi:hypothetical protein